jgi:hypothetical protein
MQRFLWKVVARLHQRCYSFIRILSRIRQLVRRIFYNTYSYTIQDYLYWCFCMLLELRGRSHVLLHCGLPRGVFLLPILYNLLTPNLHHIHMKLNASVTLVCVSFNEGTNSQISFRIDITFNFVCDSVGRHFNLWVLYFLSQNGLLGTKPSSIVHLHTNNT